MRPRKELICSDFAPNREGNISNTVNSRCNRSEGMNAFYALLPKWLSSLIFFAIFFAIYLALKKRKKPSALQLAVKQILKIWSFCEHLTQTGDQGCIYPSTPPNTHLCVFSHFPCMIQPMDTKSLVASHQLKMRVSTLVNSKIIYGPKKGWTNKWTISAASPVLDWIEPPSGDCEIEE